MVGFSPFRIPLSLDDVCALLRAEDVKLLVTISVTVEVIVAMVAKVANG